MGRNRPYRLAVLTSYAAEESVMNRLIQLDAVCKARNIKMIVFSTSSPYFSANADPAVEKWIYLDINYSDFDAVLCYSELIKNDEILESVVEGTKKAGIPVFMLEKHVDGGIDLCFDYCSAFEELCQYVIGNLDLHKVVFMGGMPDNPFSLDRENIFKKVMKANGRELDENSICYGDFWEFPAKKALDDLLAKGILPEAIICANDLMALAVCQKLEERGLRIPNDVVVTGCDGIERAKLNDPELATCVLDESEISTRFIDIILDYTEGRNRQDKYVLKYRFYPAASCGFDRHRTHDIFNIVQGNYDRNREYIFYQVSMFHMTKGITNAHNMDEIREELFKYIISHGLVALDYNMEEFRDKVPLNQADYEGADTDDLMYVFFQGWMNADKDNRICRRSELVTYYETYLERGGNVMAFPLHFSGELYGYMMFEILPEPLFFSKILLFNNTLGNSLGVYKAKRSLLIANQLLETANEKLAELYVKDHLTMLYNRRGFYNQIKHMIYECAERGWDIYVLSIDMDDLKVINDNYGHSEGDVALKTFGQAMLAAAGERDICARFGGDEFIMAGEAEDGHARGKEVIEAINRTLEEYNSTAGKPYTVKGSMGLSVRRPDNDLVIDELMLAADQMMYENKKERKKFRDSSRK